MARERTEHKTERVEVNLVPMIDIMFQLIAFFTMLINLDTTNRDERVRLPIADLARPSEMTIDEMLVLNVNRHGQATLLGELVDIDDEAFRQYLAREAQQSHENMKRARVPIDIVAGRPRLWTTVLIRADQDVEYGKIERMMRSCRNLGFHKFALRATAEAVE